MGKSRRTESLYGIVHENPHIKNLLVVRTMASIVYIEREGKETKDLTELRNLPRKKNISGLLKIDLKQTR